MGPRSLRCAWETVVRRRRFAVGIPLTHRCIAAGWPYVVPVNYFFDGKDIYIHSLPGKKLDALRANPRACLQVDEITGVGEEW